MTASKRTFSQLEDDLDFLENQLKALPSAAENEAATLLLSRMTAEDRKEYEEIMQELLQ